MIHSRTLHVVVAALASCLGALAQGQTLRHEKYALPNGMTVILHEDHTLPTVSVNIWYKVGARCEPPHRSGFAHLFEHLMFMGTKRVPGNDFDVIMETGGGANNASTSLDRTNYFSWGPSELLPTLLWLDADRLERMGLDMTQDKLNKQRDVVRNERRQTVENAPYQKAYEASYQLLYPPTHPYYNGVIGTHEDLESAQVQDVQDFFATFYVAGNASLVVAGDFDPAMVKPMVAGLFGTLPRGNAPAITPVPEPKLDRVIRSTSLDKVQLPKVAFSYLSPGQYRAGDAECDLAGLVLGGGQSSRVYKRLVLKDQVAVDVAAMQDSSMLGSVFRVEVTGKPGSDLGAIEAAMDEEIGLLCKDGPTAEELAERKAEIELAKVTPLQSVQYRADRLNEYDFYLGTPDGLEKDLARYRNATREGVARWAHAVMTPTARLIQVVLPEKSEGAGSPRDARPQGGAASAFVPPSPAVAKLSNGINMMVWTRPKSEGGLPLAAATLLIAPGGALDQADQAGRCELMSQMLSEGTGDLDGPAFAAAMQSLGASFHANAGTETFTVGVSGLSGNFDKAVALWARAIREPRMDDKDFTRVKGLHLEDLAQSEEEPQAVAPRVAMRVLLGDANPYGRSVNGTPKTVGTLTLADIKGGHATLIKPENATLLVAGDLTLDEAKKLFDRELGGWARGTGSPGIGKSTWSAPKRDGLSLAIVDRPGAPQTMVMFASPGVPMGDERRAKIDMVGTILGGSFTSRLNQNLRERNGFTYGVRADFAMQPSAGWFYARSAVRTDATGAALKEFMSEFDRIRSGDITADEARKAAKTMRQELVQGMGTLGGLLGQAQRLEAAHMPWETLGKDIAAAAKTDAGELNAMARDVMTVHGGVLVLVGDKTKIVPQLQDLQLPAPVYLDAWGEPAASSN